MTHQVYYNLDIIRERPTMHIAAYIYCTFNYMFSGNFGSTLTSFVDKPMTQDKFTSHTQMQRRIRHQIWYCKLHSNKKV